MDILLVDRVIAHKGITAAQKLVLIALAVARSAKGFSLKRAVTKGALKDNPLLYRVLDFIEAERITTLDCVSEMTGYTVRNVRNIVNGLCDKGLVIKDGKRYLIREDCPLLNNYYV